MDDGARNVREVRAGGDTLRKITELTGSASAGRRLRHRDQNEREKN